MYHREVALEHVLGLNFESRGVSVEMLGLRNNHVHGVGCMFCWGSTDVRCKRAFAK